MRLLGEDEIIGLIHFSEELAQNPLKTVHYLSFDKAKFEIQLLQNRPPEECELMMWRVCTV